ncbi:MAG: 3D-(3,5/4)-trihydroxycyclohexane-1,2-dione acylhydrolase (decyclizing) [Spirochaetes bacterium]|nr:3D-(3,5/4)-trihydroxycyclohexane-1,2-dione acylhydrolase (decyclizing) [Spirochaetota bacterium]
MKNIRLTMGQALVKFLDNQYINFDGEVLKFVEGVFGIFGHGCVVGIGEALQETNHNLTFYQGHNEQGMAHTAIAYAKQSNRKRIMAVTTSIGPGALNMVTAAGLATVNRIPVLLLPGDTFACRQPDPVLQQVEQSHDLTISANDAFKPVCKYWDRISRPEQLMSAAVNAMRVLTDPAETGAVCLALPQDVQGEAYDYPEYFFEKRIHTIKRQELSSTELEEAVSIIKQSKKPLVICGGGVRYSEAGKELADFCNQFNIPFGETQAGKSSLTWDHPMNLGGIGVTGTLAANKIAHDADLVIGIGTRFSDFTTASKWNFKNPDVRFMTINLNKFDAYKMNATPFLADAKAGIAALTNTLKTLGYQSCYQKEIEEARTEWASEVDKLYQTDEQEGFSQTRALGLLNEELMAQDAVVVGASGSLPGDLQRVWRPRSIDSYHMEYGFSCMGYEVCGTLGAKIAEPDKDVYCMVGDGSYIMLHSELFTSIQEGIKINILLFDNHGFQCIDNLQGDQGIPHFGCEFRFRNPQTKQLDGNYIPVDFAANARSYGCQAWTVHNPEELKKAMAEAQKSPVSTLIDIKVLPKSMTDGYSSWWRVGTPEVSQKSQVTEACKDMKKNIAKTFPY